MAKELIHTIYRDADGTLQRTRSFTINIWHPADVMCDCQRRDGHSLRGTKHRYRVTTRTDNFEEAKTILAAHRKSIARDNHNREMAVS
jgi:hypothetical protein